MSKSNKNNKNDNQAQGNNTVIEAHQHYSQILRRSNRFSREPRSSSNFFSFHLPGSDANLEKLSDYKHGLVQELIKRVDPLMFYLYYMPTISAEKCNSNGLRVSAADILDFFQQQIRPTSQSQNPDTPLPLQFNARRGG